VYFANYLSICHEAYEEALGSAGMALAAFFSKEGVVVPIAKCEAEYLRPVACGDKLSVCVSPKSLTEASFEIRFEVTRLGDKPKTAARIRTEHVCIDSASRARRALPEPLAGWVSRG
jgi:1,4-dihydroxy-2-naphthoyl-CoA hydrolase